MTLTAADGHLGRDGSSSPGPFRWLCTSGFKIPRSKGVEPCPIGETGRTSPDVHRFAGARRKNPKFGHSGCNCRGTRNVSWGNDYRSWQIQTVGPNFRASRRYSFGFAFFQWLGILLPNTDSEDRSMNSHLRLYCRGLGVQQSLRRLFSKFQ